MVICFSSGASGPNETTPDGAAFAGAAVETGASGFAASFPHAVRSNAKQRQKRIFQPWRARAVESNSLWGGANGPFLPDWQKGGYPIVKTALPVTLRAARARMAAGSSARGQVALISGRI